jgi:glycosyltransferase involved in cell wall biosynthesis
MIKKYRLLVLFEEMAPYFWECLRKLSEKFPVDVLLISKKINPIAPFDFKPIDGVRWLIRDEHKEVFLLQEIQSFLPDCIYVSGWLHKPYHEWIKKNRSSKVILGFDTQWNGNMRQILGSIYFRIFKKKYYTHAFVPNARQFKFAQKLGFDKDYILDGIYCCDTDYFSGLFNEFISKRNQWPKNILFLGRYVNEKGFMQLQDAFIEFDLKYPGQSWKLLLAGKGPLSVRKHPKIIDLGFVQPKDLKDVILQTGFFILPSKFEPYGVVLHEMAIAGMPLISSVFCGASDDYLEEGKNGFLLHNITVPEMVRVFENVLNLDDKKLREMSEKSHELGNRNTLEKWAENVYKLLKS